MKDKLLNLKTSPFQRIFFLVTCLFFSVNQAHALDANCGEIESIEFSNGTSQVTINDNGTYNLESLPNDFYINTNVDGYSQSVRYIVKNLDTNQVYSITENYEPYTFPSGNQPWNLGTGSFSVKVKLYKYNYGWGFKCDQQTLTFTITDECSAFAGTLTADSSPVSLIDGGATISATPNGDINVPEGYSSIYVLTQGEGLVIVNAGAEPSFTVTESGNYTIHTLVYNPDTLDLGIVQIGQTTGVDVYGLITEGGGEICASLDVAGAPIMVEEAATCNAYAGTVRSNNVISCLSGGISNISAYVNNDPVIPNGYQQLYVLTNAFDLTILNVSTTPEFDVSNVGFYRIHSLVYNPDTLDLGIVQIGQTTGFDVNGLLQQGGGEICASLDVQGAVFLVLPLWICNWFNYSYNSRGTDQTVEVEAYLKQFDNYQAFEKSLLEQAKPRLYPNPAKNILNLEVKLLDNEVMTYTITEISGRQVQAGSVDNVIKRGSTFDTSSLSNGMYIVRFKSDYREFVSKIQVLK